MDNFTDENGVELSAPMREISMTMKELRAENRKLTDEIERLRPLARLAEVIAVMEGANHKQHDELIETDRKFDELNHKYLLLQKEYQRLLDKMYESAVPGNGQQQTEARKPTRLFDDWNSQHEELMRMHDELTSAYRKNDELRAEIERERRQDGWSE
jgi:hypothetical protein